MPASSASRALLLGIAAIVLTAGGFYLGRRLSEPSAAPAPPSLGPDEGSVGEPRDEARMSEQERAAGSEGVGNAPGGVEPAAGAAGGRRSTAGQGAPPRPGGAPAAPGLTAAPAGTEPNLGTPPLRPGGPGGFVAGLTQIGSTRSSSAALKGFDQKAVDVKRAPETAGAIEFEVAPSQVTPGQAYTVKVYLRNHGSKPIRIKRLTIASEMNGSSSRGSMSPRSREVEPSLVGLLAELPGVWKEDVASWSLEVQVLTSGGDTYRNRVAWK